MNSLITFNVHSLTFKLSDMINHITPTLSDVIEHITVMSDLMQNFVGLQRPGIFVTYDDDDVNKEAAANKGDKGISALELAIISCLQK